ncbi:MAG: SRPBCC family protein [Bacteroidota bacterium]
MKVYKLKRTQKLNISIKEAWEFFSSPLNLKEITPEFMQFNVLTDLEGVRMYEGMIIEYTVRPKLNIPIHWVTEIKSVSEPYFFIDEQRFGPYRFWHHEHHFQEVDDGVIMDDIVHYAIPYGFLGRIAGSLFVEKDVNDIFDYRFDVLEKKFNQKKKSEAVLV